MAAAVVSGLSVMVMIVVFGRLSGAHFNPAVTVAFIAVRKFPVSEGPAYAFSQFAGGIVAALMAYLIFGHASGAHVPNEPVVWKAFGMEAIVGAMLMATIIGVVSGEKTHPFIPAIAIGAAVVLGVLIAGPFSGGSMNPARSLGPALFVGGPAVTSIWIYLSAPVLGAVLAALLYEWLAKPTAA